MLSLTVLMLSCVDPPGSGAAVLAPFGTPKRAVRAPTHRVFVVCLENLVVDVVRQQTLRSILTSQQTLTSILTSQQTLPSILTSGWMWCLPCPPPAFSF